LRNSKELEPLIKTQSGARIKCLKTDGGGEYTSNEFKELFESQGITHDMSPIHSTKEWSGRKVKQDPNGQSKVYVKRKGHRLKFWDEAVNTALFLKNRAPTSCLKLTLKKCTLARSQT